MVQNIDSYLTAESFLLLILIIMFCPLKQNHSGQLLSFMSLCEIMIGFVVFSLVLHSSNACCLLVPFLCYLRLHFLLFIKLPLEDLVHCFLLLSLLL